MHSATKYLNGHSDVVAGVLVTRAEDDFWARIKTARAAGGAVLGPFEAWLLNRGLRTLFPARAHRGRFGTAHRAALRATRRCSPYATPACPLTPATTSPAGRWMAASAPCCRCA